MQPMLSFENAPPLWLPFSFFLAAPCWLLLFAAQATGIASGQINASPLTLALTHTLALGVLGNVMLGALFQILAVLSGIGPRHPRRWLHGIFWPFQAGCGLLVTAFLTGFTPWLLNLGATLLALTLLVFSLGLSLIAFKSPARDPSTRGMRLALIGLAVSASLGWTLSNIISRGWALDFNSWLARHILWTSNGWVLMLLISVALTVVPMFQITRAYPSWLRHFLPFTLSIAVLSNQPAWVALLAAIFLIATLKLQSASKRPHDMSRKFWLAAMSLGLVAIGLWLQGTLWPLSIEQDLRWRLIGWLWLAGVGFGTICAMLYKIVPFLIWLALKANKPPRGALPTMQAFIGENAMRHALWAYALWLVSGIVACVYPASGRWLLSSSSAVLAGLLLQHMLQALLLGQRLRRNWSNPPI